MANKTLDDVANFLNNLNQNLRCHMKETLTDVVNNFCMRRKLAEL